MTDDPFFTRLRTDARSLRHVPDAATLERISARIRAHLERDRPTVAQLLAAWFRPLVATAVAVTIAAAIGIATVKSNDVSFIDTALEISVAGETYRVGG
jgi:hypothetical protein